MTCVRFLIYTWTLIPRIYLSVVHIIHIQLLIVQNREKTASRQTVPCLQQAETFAAFQNTCRLVTGAVVLLLIRIQPSYYYSVRAKSEFWHLLLVLEATLWKKANLSQPLSLWSAYYLWVSPCSYKISMGMFKAEILAILWYANVENNTWAPIINTYYGFSNNDSYHKFCNIVMYSSSSGPSCRNWFI